MDEANLNPNDLLLLRKKRKKLPKMKILLDIQTFIMAIAFPEYRIRNT